MKKNLKILLMFAIVTISLSCASTSELSAQKSSQTEETDTKKEYHVKLQEEKEEYYQPRILPSFDW